MVRFSLFLLAAAGACGAVFSLDLLSAGAPLGGASFFALFGASTALAAAACGHLDALVFACGAVSGVAAAALLPWSPAAAGAALGLGVFAERSLRVPGGARRALHLALSALAGVAAALVCSRHASSAAPQQVAAAVMAAALLAAPLLIQADDPVVHLLDLAARSVGARSAGPLREASSLRRWAATQPMARGSGRLWGRLEGLVRQRSALPPLPNEPDAASYRSEPRDEGPDLRQARSVDAQIVDTLAALRRALGQA